MGLVGSRRTIACANGYFLDRRRGVLIDAALIVSEAFWAVPVCFGGMLAGSFSHVCGTYD